ncbi:MAG TPA: hypothetical protein VI564_01875, partial [Candidatus Nanoarchaeia archaeon]|nr:hypothetical protein [Candidatus Nanoarchaeia archaeon]
MKSKEKYAPAGTFVTPYIVPRDGNHALHAFRQRFRKGLIRTRTRGLEGRSHLWQAFSEGLTNTVRKPSLLVKLF